ncbi:DNA repair protein RAD5A [Linum grandiflorum]
MGSKVSDEMLTTVRSIVGSDFSDMDIIRALHLAKHDPTAAINIIFDTPNFNSKQLQSPRSPNLNPTPRRIPVSAKSRNAEKETGENCNLVVDEDATNPVGSDSGMGNEQKVRFSGSSSYAGSVGDEWWYLGDGVVAGLSTSKGRKVKAGDEVTFAFPVNRKSKSSAAKGFGKGRSVAAACSEIVRFSTVNGGEIGRIPNEWGRCLLPLVRDKKVMIEGHCKSAPEILGIMDTIELSVSVYINSAMFHKFQQTSLKAGSNPSEETVVHPLPNLFRLLGLTPFKKAALTPADLYTKKRPFLSKDSPGLHASVAHARKLNQLRNENDSEDEELISEADLDQIVGIGQSNELAEMDPPSTLQCELRSYQKQALHWMMELEKGRCVDEAATTLHPCWEAYRPLDKRGLVIYLNAFSGDATVDFPSTLKMARGGILADAMGLGKTIMTIALLLTHSENSRSSSCISLKHSREVDEVGDASNQSSSPLNGTKFSGFDKHAKQRKALSFGGNLIVCPMTLLGQWKTAAENGGLYSVHWFRVVLDEAHTIKSSKSQISLAAAGLIANRRWCLTGTPIQNKLEDLYSLLRFLKVEPWENWAWWSKLIQKPYEEGDERGLKLVQSILKTIMLRRTKSSTDREGSRGDTQEYSEMNKLAKRLLKSGQSTLQRHDQDVPSVAYIQEVVNELQKGEQGECPICLEAFEDAVLTPCAHRLCRECLLSSWRNASSGLCPVCRKAVTKQELITAPTDSRFQIDVEKNWIESSKVVALLRELEILRASGSKSIVFSQWTAFLDLLQIALTRNNISFLRLDGTLNLGQREKVIKQFSEDDNIMVLLMSLKAGGVGINLTAASSAFVMDPWWNPAVEEQAVMRIHRIGQTKPVMIKRFIVKGTVEERMVAVQARKHRMISGALTDQELKELTCNLWWFFLESSCLSGLKAYTLGHRDMPSDADKWGWEHVSVFGGFDKGSGTKRWKCNHCGMRYNGSYSRVRAHLLGCSGVGVKSCPAIDRSMREAFQILEEEQLDRKRKKNASSTAKPGKRYRTSQSTLLLKPISKEDVDDTVGRFFFAAGLSMGVINSSYFLDMVKAIGAFGSDYESPSLDVLTDSLSREKVKLVKSVSLLRESWPHTGCSILCVACLDGGLGSFHVSTFVSSPRGLVFLKAVDVNDSDEGKHAFVGVLNEAIKEIGQANVVQIVSDLDNACKPSESCISSEFSGILWSPCTRRSMLKLMEEVAELEWAKPVISCGKAIERCMMDEYQDKSLSCKFMNLKCGSFKLSPSYGFLQAIYDLRQTLQEVVASEQWRQWKHSLGKDVSNIEASILGDDLWSKVHLLLELYEPFVQVITALEKTIPGDICDWRIQTVEALRGKAIDDDLLNQLECLIDNRWDVLFSPLHAAGYILNPRFIGKGQSKDKHVMRGWKAVVERYESDSNRRRVLREQLSSYWRLEGCLGEEDAVDSRDKLEGVAWWESFGFEMPELQTLAIRVLSQVSSVGSICNEMWETQSSWHRDKADDVLFVRNNLRLESQRIASSGPKSIVMSSSSTSELRSEETVPMLRLE